MHGTLKKRAHARDTLAWWDGHVVLGRWGFFHTVYQFELRLCQLEQYPYRILPYRIPIRAFETPYDLLLHVSTGLALGDFFFLRFVRNTAPLMQALCFSAGLASTLAALGVASSAAGRAYGAGIGDGAIPLVVAVVAILMGLNLLEVGGCGGWWLTAPCGFPGHVYVWPQHRALLCYFMLHCCMLHVTRAVLACRSSPYGFPRWTWT